MIGLNASASDDGISPFLKSIGQEVFQFPHLIAAQFKTGEIVPLDPDLSPPTGREPFEGVERGRSVS